jgi:hypothetical protein
MFSVPADDIVVNNPSEIIILIPPLIRVICKLEITTQYAVSKCLKDPAQRYSARY